MVLLPPSQLVLLLSHPLTAHRAILGVDYGVVSVGFAVARSLAGRATPLPSFRQPPRRGAAHGESPRAGFCRAG